jgi:hypothetical protein
LCTGLEEFVGGRHDAGVSRRGWIIGVPLMLASMLSALSACSSVADSPCETVAFTGPESLSAEGDASCPPYVGYEDKVYTVTCVALRVEQLGSEDLQGIAISGVLMQARAIAGVEPDSAIAVTYFHKEGCGTWQLALGDVSQAEAKRLTRMGRTGDVH